MSENQGKIAVLFGGSSAEREVSLNSGSAVLNSLLSQGFNAVGIDAEGDELKIQLKEQNIDRCVIMFHGSYGEGGQVQNLLENLGIPYSGSDTQSSLTGMNKLKCKSIWREAGLMTANSHLMQNDQDVRDLKFPLAIKPTSDGSSIGVHYVKTIGEVKAAYQDASKYGDVMAEEWIIGKELTVTIIGNKVLPIIWIKSDTNFYDYKAKYITDSTEYICPVDLPEELKEDIQSTAKKAFDIIGCSGWGRVDFILDNNKFYLLELNTIPGMTNHSLVPKAAQAIGWNFDGLVRQILLSAKG